MSNLLVIVGPSGIGKSFAVHTLCAAFPNHFARLKVHTTRPPRASETGENDRIFVSKEQFENMARSGLFGVHYQFAGSWYGYTKQALQLSKKHVVTNAPPFSLPKFTHFKNLIVVGLQAPADYSDFLRARIEARGDTFLARKTFIERDMQDLKTMGQNISKHGKIFEVKDNSTIPAEVLPWIARRLGIS